MVEKEKIIQDVIFVRKFDFVPQIYLIKEMYVLLVSKYAVKKKEHINMMFYFL